jgi:hypothetical protein
MTCKHENRVKNGHQPNGRQKWLCKDCGAPFQGHTTDAQRAAKYKQNHPGTVWENETYQNFRRRFRPILPPAWFRWLYDQAGGDALQLQAVFLEAIALYAQSKGVTLESHGGQGKNDEN